MQPNVLYRRIPDLVAIHGRAVQPRDLEPVLTFEDPPILVCRLGRVSLPRPLRQTTVSAVYALAPDGAPAVPTGLVLVCLREGIPAAERRETFLREGFTLHDILPYAPNAAWVKATSGGISRSLRGIPALEALPDVENVEPQMLRRPSRR
ncbi:MAG: hypothetical protein ACRENJ_08105 [Candidatus Eiseniibacteriota bacterium]